MHRSTFTPKRVRFEEWPCIHPNAAGMDIGARAIVVAVPPKRDAEPVRVCETFTPDLPAWVDWLVTCPMDTVAMEFPGGSGVPIFALLEPRGLMPSLVNARMLHLQNTLTRMHMPWSEVLADLMGVTAHTTVRAIVTGERDPEQLAPWRNPAGQSSADRIAQALSGTWRDVHVCILQPALELFDDSTQQSAEYDAQIERPCAAMQPRYDAWASRMRRTGVDLVAVTGLSASIAQTIPARSARTCTASPP